MTPQQALARFIRGDEKFVITGATGWFGAVALDLLDDVLGPARCASNVTCFASAPRTMVTASGRQVPVRSLDELAGSLRSPVYLLHFAYLTRDRVSELGVAPFLLANLRITQRVLEALQTDYVRGLAWTSSGVARGVPDVDNEPYGFLKRVDELALNQAAEESGTTTARARVYSVAGPHITKPENYALGSLISMAQAGGPIRVQASNEVIRSYVGVDEVVALLVIGLLISEDLQFETGGESIEIGDLAALVADVHGLPAGSVERTVTAPSEADEYIGDPADQLALAARFGLTMRSVRELVTETSSWLGHARRAEASATLTIGANPEAVEI